MVSYWNLWSWTTKHGDIMVPLWYFHNEWMLHSFFYLKNSGVDPVMGYMWYELVRMVTSRAWSSGWPFLVRRNQPFLASSHWSRAQHENFGANRALHSLPADSEPSCAHARCKMPRKSHQDRPAQPLIPRLVSGLTDQLDPQVHKDIKDHQRSCSNIKYLQILENIVADNTNIIKHIYIQKL